MNEEIEAKVTYTSEDFVRHINYIKNRQFLYRYSLLIPVVIIACILLFLYLSEPNKFTSTFLKPQNVLVLTIPVLFLCSWWLLRKYSPNFLLKRKMENQFKSSPALREPQFVSFDEEGFYATNQFGSGQTKWEAITQVTETDDDFLLFPESKIAQFVPKRFFKLPS